jgi:hypothetical protein
MQDSTSARSLIVQLSSLVNHLEKMASGSVEDKDIELMAAVNNVLKDCILGQKRIKLQKANQNMLAEAENYISDADHQRLKAFLDNMKPSMNVLQQRVARLIGDMRADGTISAANVKSNVLYIFETLKNKLGNDAQEVAEIQVMSLQSVEAIWEVVRRLIIQEGSKARR